MNTYNSHKITDPKEQMARMLDLAGIKKGTVNETNIGTNATILHEAVASNGDEYGIIQEEQYVYIKKKYNGNYDYIDGVGNIKEHSHKSYAHALKDLNMIFKDINESVDHKEGINLFKKKV